MGSEPWSCRHARPRRSPPDRTRAGAVGFPRTRRITIGVSSICTCVSAIVEREILPAIVASAASGDEVAFARIIAAHHADMVRVAYLVTTDIELAHEAVQSAWLLAVRKLHTLRDGDRLRPWLMSVAANEARQQLRRHRRRRLVEIQVESLAEEQEPHTHGDIDRDAHMDLLAGLGHLTPEDRSVLAMRFAMGLTSKEIARETGLSAPG